MTISRKALVFAALATGMTVTTIILFGRWAWLVNAGFAYLAGWALYRATSTRAVVARQSSNAGPSADGQAIADAIRDVEARQAFRRLAGM